MTQKKLLTILTILLLTPLSSNAGQIAGFAAIDTRLFFQEPAFAPQKTNNIPSLIAEPEYYHVTKDRKNTLTFRPFARLDTNDNKRNHWDIRQLDIVHAQDEWEIKAGISKVFWGVTESNHLVDIINQTDAIENFDGEDKLGQPMVQLGLFKDWGRLRLFYLPYFRERTFAGKEGRLRSAIPVEKDLTTYDSALKQWHPDLAVRYDKTINNWDIGLAHFSGTSREPNFTLKPNSSGETILAPHYDIINQTSTDIQYTNEGWLWKAEAISRSGQGRRFAAFTGGFEYTIYAIANSNMDLGLLTEYQFDDRSPTAPATFSNNDTFAGTRLTFNDTQDTAILAGTSIDNDTQAATFLLEAETRIGNSWKVELKALILKNIKPPLPESTLRRDSHVQLRLAKYF
jgi:hypothetical protein